MAMRLHELHPSLVHFPIALLPTSVVADLLGRVTGDQRLHDVGRLTMPLAAAGAALAGIAGFIAQEEVVAEDEAHPALVTHRTLNVGLLGSLVGMAWHRVRRERPGWGYLAAGIAGVSVLGYSAYLGGHMVYEHGVGVRAAGGIDEGAAPEIHPRDAQRLAAKAAADAAHGLRHAAHHLAEGDVVPTLTERDTDGG
jgi:uncharacterized membrane protein